MTTIRKQMLEISRLSEESDGIYHDIAQSYRLPDSVYWILYILYNYDEPVSQVDLCSQWAYSKQTINSSIASMIKKEWITLEALPGMKNRKRIVLTEAGRELFLSLFRQTNQYMREEYEKIHAKNSK